MTYWKAVRMDGTDFHTIPVEGWAMTATDTHWHHWRGDTTVCGLTRTADWSLGLVRAGDCPACTDQLNSPAVLSAAVAPEISNPNPEGPLS